MRNKRKVESRNEQFTEKTATKIWREIASEQNPYIAAAVECHGYDLFELIEKRSFVDVFFLLFQGELPDKNQSELLEKLMIALINPGPRHPATRAGMNTAIGKSNPMHILPIAMSVLGGKYRGGADIASIMRFFRKNSATDAAEFVEKTLSQQPHQHGDNTGSQSEIEIMPGFGRYYGGLDNISCQLAQTFFELDNPGPALSWGVTLNKRLHPYGAGWLITGVAAAVLSDLGFHPRAGGCLFQLLGAPGLAAHGIELSNKPFNAMPFVKDEDYVIE